MHIVHNLLGIPKRFRMIDGCWENPTEAKSWMSDKTSALDKLAEIKDARVARDVRLKELAAK